MRIHTTARPGVHARIRLGVRRRGGVAISRCIIVCHSAVRAVARVYPSLAEGEGFEPPKSFPLPVFKTGAISQALPPLQIDYFT